MRRRSRGRQIGQYLADDAGELEAVAGTRGGKDDPRMKRVPVDDEVLVRRVRINTSLEASNLPRRGGNIADKHVQNRRGIRHVAILGRVPGAVQLATRQMRSHLDAGAGQVRE